MARGARASRIATSLALSLCLAAACVSPLACRRETALPTSRAEAAAAVPATPAPGRTTAVTVPAPPAIWQRPSIGDYWNHVRRVQALLDKWIDAVVAGDFNAIRPLYHPSAVRVVRQGAGAPVTDVATWIALRQKERQDGRVLDGGRRLEIWPSNIEVDNDKIWVSFVENVKTANRRERRARRFVFQGVATPLITDEWEGAVEPGWRDNPPRPAIPILARSAGCPGAMPLDASPFWLVVADEATHAAALARVERLRADGKPGEIVLGTPPGAAPPVFMVVAGVAGDRAAAEAAAARSGARVVEPASIAGVGPGQPLRFTGSFALRSHEELVLAAGRWFWIRAFGALHRYRLDPTGLVLVAQLDVDVLSAQFAARNGTPYMKTKSGAWLRIDPETGRLAALGDQPPPPFAGTEATVGDTRFTFDPKRRGIVIARGSAPEAFIPDETFPSVFAAEAPGGAGSASNARDDLLVVKPGPTVQSVDVALYEVVAQLPAAGVAKLCGELVWSMGKGIAEQPFSIGGTTFTTGRHGAYEIWLPANRRLALPRTPPDTPACSVEGYAAGLFLPPWGGLLLPDAGLHQTFTYLCQAPREP